MFPRGPQSFCRLTSGRTSGLASRRTSPDRLDSTPLTCPCEHMSSPYEILGLPKHALLDTVLANKSTALYSAPSDEPLGWDKHNKLVPLSVVVMAAHLTVARIGFGPLLSFVDAILERVHARVARWVDDRAVQGFFVLIGLPAKALNNVRLLKKLMDEQTVQRKQEEAIRSASLQSMREVWNARLFASHQGRRRTKKVLSRHPSPKQRKQNKLWRSPRS